MEKNGRITAWLSGTTPAVFSVYAMSMAFTAYFCMYAYRRPFAVGTYEDQTVHLPGLAQDLGLKSALVISQIFGYLISKYIGIKFCSEIEPQRRAWALVAFILFSQSCWVVFGLSGPMLQLIAIFCSALPLGMVWGLVYGYLEGRRTSELLGAGLSTSFIVSSGFVKMVGRWWMHLGVSEHWMPAVTGLCFMPPMFLAVWLLKQVPRPTAMDIRERVKRVPMDRRKRMAFLWQFFWGLLPLVFLYFFLTAYRDFRDNFIREIWDALGQGDNVAIYAIPEMFIAFAVLVGLAMLNLVKSNRLGLLATHVMMIAGSAGIGISTLLFEFGIIDGPWWMTLVGLGLYVAYVPYGCVLFDRMIAATGVLATSVFAIYVADLIGYCGSMSVILYKEFWSPDLSWLEFFRSFSYFTSALCCGCFVLSTVYFMMKTRSVRVAP